MAGEAVEILILGEVAGEAIELSGGGLALSVAVSDARSAWESLAARYDDGA